MKPKIKQVKFEKSAFKPEDLPVSKLPEVAFLGRSNVGKSSLINAFLGQKRLARVSSTPGFTKAINFYRVDHRFWVVDLPGFGFAKVPPKMRAQWKKLIETYLSSPRLTKLLVLIFDIRREPDELDFMLIDYVKSLGRNFIVVLNKIDRAKKTDLPKLKRRYLEKLSLEESQVFLCSCKTREGLEPIKQKIWESLAE